MTVSVPTNKVAYDGTGSTTVFSFAFSIFSVTDLRIILRDTTGAETVKALTTDYSVSPSPWTTGGSITMLVAPAIGETLLIKRQISATQLVDYRDGDAFPAETHEGALDKLTYLIQQLQEETGRAVTLQEVTALSGLVLPDPTPGTVLYSADGASLDWGTLTTLTGSPIVTPVSVLDGGTGASTAAGARTNLGEVAGGSFFTKKHNFAATVAPTPSDDGSAGYSVGSHIYNTTTDVIYDCIDASVGAAIWLARTTDTGPAFKNRLINGDMRIDQRNAGAAVVVNSNTTFYGLDMWRGFGAAADGVFNLARSTASPPPGFTHFLRATVTTADGAIGATQSYSIYTVIEGSTMSDIGFGAAGASTLTLSFKVRSSLSGTFSGSLRNNANNRSYAFSFSISAVNTWETKAITISGDTAGTWPTDNSGWGLLSLDLGAGTSLRKAANSWDATASVTGVTGAVSLIATNGATFDLTGVQLEPGNAATAFEQLSMQTKLQRCEAYFEKSFALEQAAVQNSLTTVGCFYALQVMGASISQGLGTIWFRTRKRATPTMVFYNPSAANAQARNSSTGTDYSGVSATSAGEICSGIFGTSPAGSASGQNVLIHWSASAEL
jgi:hypothetical protein